MCATEARICQRLAALVQFSDHTVHLLCGETRLLLRTHEELVGHGGVALLRIGKCRLVLLQPGQVHGLLPAGLVHRGEEL